jgi:hypothetical protein
MDNPVAPADALDVEQLLRLHTLTKEISKFCHKQFRGHLDTVVLLFSPRRILGEVIEAPLVSSGDRLCFSEQKVSSL